MCMLTKLLQFVSEVGFENRPRFEGVIGQNKIQQTYDHNSIFITKLIVEL